VRAMDDIFEREYIDPINAKKQEIVGIMSAAFMQYLLILLIQILIDD
jgi:hypothetical protein